MSRKYRCANLECGKQVTSDGEFVQALHVSEDVEFLVCKDCKDKPLTTVSSENRSRPIKKELVLRKLKEIVIIVTLKEEATVEQINAFAQAVEVQSEDISDENGEDLGDLPVIGITAISWEECDHCEGRRSESCGKCRGMGRQSRELL